MSVFIELTQGYQSLIDLEDLAFIGGFKWHVVRNKKHNLLYARTNVKRGEGYVVKYLHQLLLPDASLVDHINGDGLDNRRCNLRTVTHEQNMFNRRDRPGRSGVVGVQILPNGKYRARASVKNKKICLGCHTSLQDATYALDEFKNKYRVI